MTQAVRIRRREIVGMLVVAALTAAVISINVRATTSVFDGGISSSAATFTLHGLLPYRDYWLLYGPLSGFLLAIPTAIFGPTLELTRAIGFAVFCAQAVIAYRLARVWASPGPAGAIAISAVVMVPAATGLELQAWALAMTLALAAIYLSVATERSGVAIGLLIGATFLCRVDVGAYALIGVLMVRDRRAVLLGVLVVAIPSLAIALATTSIGSLVEQLIWYPLVGPRQFRGIPGLEVIYPQPIAVILQVPLLILPRLAIVLAAARLVWMRRRGEPSGQVSRLLGLVAFAALCQLQTQGRGDVEHLALAATPAILLFAVWFRDRLPSPARFGALVAIMAASLTVGFVGHRLHPSPPGYDEAIDAVSAWVRSATAPNERIFVGLTSHKFTVINPLIVYFLADRAPGVRDTMFNPGVTNTDWGQTRMVEDLERNAVPYVVLDGTGADHGEWYNDSRIPGSTLLDTYLRANFQTVCEVDDLVIQARNDLERTSPPCPTIASSMRSPDPSEWRAGSYRLGDAKTAPSASE